VKEYIFDNHDRRYWIQQVNSLCKNGIGPKIGERGLISISLEGTVEKSTFEPTLIVLFACLIEHIHRCNYDIYLKTSDKSLMAFLFDELKLHAYFSDRDKKDHVEASSHLILNLWKIVNNRSEEYSYSITEYFKRNFFQGCDLTVLKNSLDEVYSNIADHSESSGLAFSYIDYNSEKRTISVAACDLGLGIPFTLKRAYNFSSDKEALRQSLEIGVSAKTHKHNKGFGLDNIVSNLSGDDHLRIVSNNALLYCHKNKSNMRLFDLDFDFKGTLIYFDLCIDSFEKELLNDVIIG
jgi:hypothetical protein